MKKVFNKVIDKINLINNYFNNIFKKKPFKYFFQFLPNNIFLLILFIIILFLTTPKILYNDVKVNSLAYDSFCNPITKPVEQNIKIKNIKEFDSIGLIFATYGRKNTSIYEFKVFEDGKLILKQKINTKNLKDMKIKYFKTKLVKVDESKTYKFSINPIGNIEPENAITLVKNSKLNSIFYELRLDSPFNKYIIIISIIFMIIFFIINYLINNEKIKSENSFLIIMLIYFFSILLLYPAFQAPDEPYHFSKSYSLSQYDFHKNSYQNSKKKIIAPSNFKCLNYSGQQKVDNVISKDDLKNCLKETENKKTKNLKKIGPTKSLSYIPSAILIKITNIFTNSPLIIFYMGRIANLLVSIFILYTALKIIPKHKNLLLAVIFIPTFLQQMISYSYDSILNSLCILIVAYLCKFYYQKEEIKTKDLVIYSIASLLIFNIKAPYIIISLLIIFIDKSKFSGNMLKRFYSLLLVIILPIILSKFIDYFESIGAVNSSVNANHPSNISYLLHNPFQIFVVAYNTIVFRGMWYLKTMIGSIGWLRYELDSFIIVIYYIFIFLIILSNSIPLTKRNRIKNIILLFILVGGIELAMYNGWSGYKSSYVEGVQGRYFLPLLLPLTLQLMPKKNKISVSNNIIYSFINIIMYYFIFMILYFFY